MAGYEIWGSRQLERHAGSGHDCIGSEVRNGESASRRSVVEHGESDGNHPNITSATPTTGVAGTQITIAGTGFGTTQGSGNVWLGTKYGAVVSWNDTQVVATIASGAKSGTAKVLQGGVWSNTVNLTVITRPSQVRLRRQVWLGLRSR